MHMQSTTQVPSALAILARQADLVSLARQSTDDVNEAALIVHQVMSRAFQKYRSSSSDLSEALRRDMRAAIERHAA